MLISIFARMSTFAFYVRTFLSLSKYKRKILFSDSHERHTHRVLIKSVEVESAGAGRLVQCRGRPRVETTPLSLSKSSILHTCNGKCTVTFVSMSPTNLGITWSPRHRVDEDSSLVHVSSSRSPASLSLRMVQTLMAELRGLVGKRALPAAHQPSTAPPHAQYYSRNDLKANLHRHMSIVLDRYKQNAPMFVVNCKYGHLLRFIYFT